MTFIKQTKKNNKQNTKQTSKEMAIIVKVRNKTRGIAVNSTHLESIAK